jgi:hypothetical protein
MEKLTTVIGIYDKETETLAHIVDTIEEAARWIGSGVTTLYDALHRGGLMEARGYFLERVLLNESEASIYED